MYTSFTFYSKKYRFFSDLFSYFWLLFMTMILCSCWLLFFKPWLLRLPKESEKKAFLEAFWLKNPVFWQWNWKRGIHSEGKEIHSEATRGASSCLLKWVWFPLGQSYWSWQPVIVITNAIYCYWSHKLNLFHSPVLSARKNFSFRLIRLDMFGHRQCCEWWLNQKSVCFLHVWQVSTIQWKRKDIILYSLCKILCLSHIRQDISKIWSYFL